MKVTSLFIETNMYIIVTYLNLVLGIPLTHLHHLSAFMQVSSVEPPAIMASTGTRNSFRIHRDRNQEQIDCLRLFTYIDR